MSDLSPQPAQTLERGEERWNEGTSVGLAAVVSNKDDLGPEAALKNHPFALVSEGDPLSPRQLTDLVLRMCSHPCPVAPTSYSTTSKRAPGRWRAAAPIAFRNTRKT